MPWKPLSTNEIHSRGHRAVTSGPNRWQWMKVRRFVMERAGWRCQRKGCGVPLRGPGAAPAEAHHLFCGCRYCWPERGLDPAFIVALCRTHNRAAKAKRKQLPADAYRRPQQPAAQAPEPSAGDEDTTTIEATWFG